MYIRFTPYQEDKGNENKEQTIFEGLNIPEPLLHGIYAYGFENPAPVQQQCIPLLNQGRNLLVQSASGTGKKSALVIGILSIIDVSLLECQSLILCPTRDHSNLINNLACQLGAYLGIQCRLCLAGIKQSELKEQLSGAHVIIGTPGRIQDSISKQLLNVINVKTVIISDAFEVLNRGFNDQITDIMKCMPENVQCCVFTSTLCHSVLQLKELYLTNPLEVFVKNEDHRVDLASNYYIEVTKEEWKFDTLKELLDITLETSWLIYVNSALDAQELIENLLNKGYLVSYISSEQSMEERDREIASYKKGKTRVLILCGMLAQDFPGSNLTQIINYDLPLTNEDYCLRLPKIYRRFKKPLVINFKLKSTTEYLTSVQIFYRTTFQELPHDFYLRL